MASGCTVPSIEPRSEQRWLDTWEGIHTFQVFDHHLSPAEVEVTAPHDDFFWGSTQRDSAHAGNPAAVISAYLPLHRDPDPSHDLAWWNAFHPSWVLYQCDRKTPAFEFGSPHMPLDLHNPEVLRWQIEAIVLPAMAEGYGAVAVDNVFLSPGAPGTAGCGVWKDGTWIERYDAAASPGPWIDDLVLWAKGMHDALGALPRPMKLVFNLDVYSDSLIWPRLIDQLDGILDEAGVEVNGARGTGALWARKVATIRAAQAAGKAYYMMNQLTAPPSGPAPLEWSLATYLLAKDHLAAVWIAQHDAYGVDVWRPELAAAIGHPCGEPRLDGLLTLRDYSGGIVLVDPDPGRAATLALDPSARFRDLAGRMVGPAVTLQPATGAVLLSDRARCP